MGIEDAFSFSKPAKILLECDVAGFAFPLVEVRAYTKRVACFQNANSPDAEIQEISHGGSSVFKN